MTLNYINPETLVKNPAFTQAVEIRGAARTIYIGGQNSVDALGDVVGRSDLRAQARQIFKNLEAILSTAGAKLDNIIKWNIYVVAGNDPMPAFAVFQEIWGNRPNPPLITMVFVSGLAHPEYLIELDAVAIVSE